MHISDQKLNLHCPSNRLLQLYPIQFISSIMYSSLFAQPSCDIKTSKKLTDQPDDGISEKIIYRGEGNSSIVFALSNKAKVIRLLKKDGKIMKSSQDHHVTQHPMRSIKFIHLIMKPLTEPFLSGDPELIHLKSKFVNWLSSTTEINRPRHRLDKTLHLDDQYALVMDDLCTLPIKLTRNLGQLDFIGPTLSIEIKPKQGFLPIYKPSVMASSNNGFTSPKFTSSCLYGLTQNLKLARERIKERSNYCPINLFSGCPVRMRSALEGLIRNPQNNLRIFKDLILAYGESNQMKLTDTLREFFCENITQDANSTQACPLEQSLEDHLIDLVISCLLNEHETRQPKIYFRDCENFGNSSDACPKHTPAAKCRRCDNFTCPKRVRTESTKSAHRLPKVCVLSSVLRAQRLDTIGPHEALRMLDWLIEDAKSSTSGVDILEELSKPQMPIGFGAQHQLVRETKQQYCFRKVWEFLVSLTAKDCSIIITMRQINPFRQRSIMERSPDVKRHLIKDHRSGKCYMFNVGIADLDQKMPLKISRLCDNLNFILQARDEVTSTKDMSTIS